MLRNLQQNSIEIFFLFFFLNNHFFIVKAHIFIYAGCSQDKYTLNSPYVTNLNSLLSSITNSAPQALYNSFSLGNDSSTASSDGSINGLYQCRGDLKTEDCAKCIVNVVSQIGLLCPYTYGAALQLDACFVRYDHFDFLGKLDTSLSYKKCSKSTTNDAEFLRRRDDVITNLQGAIGFRVSSSGYVAGYAQCLGDIDATDCTSCLSDAVSKVKSLCGSAKAADVFLAQCYVRYWASGYYDTSSDSSNKDDVGKTVATIVGVTAGVAVIIVFLSFCRKKCG
ncbi:cysteine-rich repeat secretory 15 [Olea europaea subsp. europaea]|nr:cysteine-rich repeat secretory 15 [Olea europaea subsp. europaea]